MQGNDVIQVAGFPVARTTAEELTDHLENQIQQQKKTVLFYANTNFVVRCRHLLMPMHRRNVLIVNDGVGMDIAARFICNEKFPENLAGSDYVPYFFSRLHKPLRVFLLGSKAQVLERASRYVVESLGQLVVGTCDGYEQMRDKTDLVDVINRSNAQMVIVALGNPIQEEWILSNMNRLQCNLAMGVGALFDFWGGEKPRAPLLIRKLRLEWFFRLCIEPRRLMARYTVDFLRFLLLCQKFRRG